MNLLNSFSKPEYIHRPSQIYRRILFEWTKNKAQPTTTMLPWGLVIESNSEETIGSCIARQGLYDLTVSELLWRLCEKGDFAIDAGANIGHMTGLMSVKTGPTGKVSCFEPHPEIFPQLETNIKRWRLDTRASEIDVHNCALSCAEGSAMLYVSSDFKVNQGIASLEKLASKDARNYEVNVTTLDGAIVDNKSIDVLKIDVEGHELAVLQGGNHLLRNKNIRDIVFEENQMIPTPVTVLLQDAGYDVFFVNKRLFGLELIPVYEQFNVPDGEPPTYLATLETQRAFDCLSSRGYQVL